MGDLFSKDGNHVKPDSVLCQRVFCKIKKSRTTDPLLLPAVHRLLGKSHRVSFTILYLHKDDPSVFGRDQINFSMAATIIPLQDPVSFLFQSDSGSHLPSLPFFSFIHTFPITQNV